MMDKDLKNSIYDGIFSNVFATLTGGVFLTGFALYLGMSEFIIGILASMPFLVTVFQLPASYLIDKGGRRKKIAFWAAAMARLLWLPVIITVLIRIPVLTTKFAVVLCLLFSSYALVTISYVSWLSWMSELVPENIRGSFFGTRNMLNGAAGMLAMLIFGYFLDTVKSRVDWGLPLAFCVTFLFAVLSGMLSLRFLRRISDLPTLKSADTVAFHQHLFLPLKDINFRKFLGFAASWSFSVNFASPFFTLYFLRELELSYGFVATLGIISALADLLGMRVWGKMSDKVKNKAVIRFATWVAAFLPLAWVMARPDSIIIPIVLHVIGGGFWAGINLCMNNLLMRIAPQDNRTFFLSSYNVLTGLSAALGPIMAGSAIKFMGDNILPLLSWEIGSLRTVFLTSTLLRVFSLQLFKHVHEPEEVSVTQMVRILRSVRGLNVATGFNFLLHPFIEILREVRDSSKSQ